MPPPCCDAHPAHSNADRGLPWFSLLSETFESRNHTRVKTGSGCLNLDQFHLHARVALSGGSARHLGTSLESKLSRIKFTLVLSPPSSALQSTSFSCRVVRLRRMTSLGRRLSDPVLQRSGQMRPF